MGMILLNWTYSSDLVECPDFISNNISKYQLDFDKWLSNKESKHDYWVICPDLEDGSMALSFGSDAFVDWLNELIIDTNTKKAVILKRELESNAELKKLPHINF